MYEQVALKNKVGKVAVADCALMCYGRGCAIFLLVEIGETDLVWNQKLRKVLLLFMGHLAQLSPFRDRRICELIMNRVLELGGAVGETDS